MADIDLSDLRMYHCRYEEIFYNLVNVCYADYGKRVCRKRYGCVARDG